MRQVANSLQIVLLNVNADKIENRGFFSFLSFYFIWQIQHRKRGSIKESDVPSSMQKWIKNRGLPNKGCTIWYPRGHSSFFKNKTPPTWRVKQENFAQLMGKKETWPTQINCDPVQQKGHLVGQVYSEIMSKTVCTIFSKVSLQFLWIWYHWKVDKMYLLLYWVTYTWHNHNR